jgi:hypothetical protein
MRDSRREAGNEASDGAEDTSVQGTIKFDFYSEIVRDNRIE